MPDPRPHLGEPLALDLLNTRWMNNGPQDLLTDVDGLEIWLASAGLTGRAFADEPTLDAPPPAPRPRPPPRPPGPGGGPTPPPMPPPPRQDAARPTHHPPTPPPGAPR
ncbi:ABATE domain-containing protein, partial [Nocardia farcinica]|uniref:ABATE domain-containing protein n=1 Tax=Nocardia farcinica TaxID=37329 RepID=UPI0032AFF8BE